MPFVSVQYRRLAYHSKDLVDIYRTVCKLIWSADSKVQNYSRNLLNLIDWFVTFFAACTTQRGLNADSLAKIICFGSEAFQWLDSRATLRFLTLLLSASLAILSWMRHIGMHIETANEACPSCKLRTSMAWVALHWQRRKSLIPKKVGGGQTVCSDYDEHILATLLRSFEAFNLPLTRDDFKDKCRTLAKKTGTCILQKKAVWITEMFAGIELMTKILNFSSAQVSNAVSVHVGVRDFSHATITCHSGSRTRNVRKKIENLIWKMLNISSVLYSRVVLCSVSPYDFFYCHRE